MKKSLAQTLVSHLGVCPRCMRKSFTAAFVASVITAAAWAWAPPSLAAFIAASAVGLFGLWLAHLTVYAWRRIIVARKAPAEEVPDFARRAVFPAFASIFVGAAIATALPARFAHAETCGDSTVTCTGSTPTCCYSTQRGYYCASSAINC